MQYTIATILLTLTSTAFAANGRILKARTDPSAAQPQQGCDVNNPYSLSYASNFKGPVTKCSVNGMISASFDQGDFVQSMSVYNPADNAECIARDYNGNQVRKIGKDQVDSVVFEQGEGNQVATITCSFV